MHHPSKPWRTTLHRNNIEVIILHVVISLSHHCRGFWQSSLHCCFIYLRFVLICLVTDVLRSYIAIQSGFSPAIKFAIVLETIILLRDPFLAKLKQLYKWPHISLWNTLVYMQDAQILCCKKAYPFTTVFPCWYEVFVLICCACKAALSWYVLF